MSQQTDNKEMYILSIVAIVAVIAIINILYNPRAIDENSIGQAAYTGISYSVKTCPTQDPYHDDATYDGYCEAGTNGMSTCYYKRSGETVAHSHSLAVSCKSSAVK